MRVLLCTSGGRPGGAVLEHLRAGHGVEIAGLVRSTRILSPRYGFLRGAWEQCRRTGIRYAMYLGACISGTLETGRAPVHATRDANDPESLAFIEHCAPDLIVTAFFNQRIGASLAALAPLGAVNLHPSLLPAYRGVDPVFYARLRGEQRFGVTLHRITPELDRGPILAQRAVAVGPRESVLETTVKLYREGAALLIQHVARIAAREPGTPQPEGGDYDSWPSAQQVAALLGKGIALY